MTFFVKDRQLINTKYYFQLECKAFSSLGCSFYANYHPSILQLLRCVCFYCSRLMVDKDSPRVKELLKKTAGNARRRLTVIYEICKSKTVCEGGDELHTIGGEVVIFFVILR